MPYDRWMSLGASGDTFFIKGAWVVRVRVRVVWSCVLVLRVTHLSLSYFFGTLEDFDYLYSSIAI